MKRLSLPTTLIVWGCGLTIAALADPNWASLNTAGGRRTATFGPFDPPLFFDIPWGANLVIGHGLILTSFLVEKRWASWSAWLGLVVAVVAVWQLNFERYFTVIRSVPASGLVYTSDSGVALAVTGVALSALGIALAHHGWVSRVHRLEVRVGTKPTETPAESVTHRLVGETPSVVMCRSCSSDSPVGSRYCIGCGRPL